MPENIDVNVILKWNNRKDESSGHQFNPSGNDSMYYWTCRKDFCILMRNTDSILI